MNSIIIGSFILSIIQSILFWEKKPGISVLIFAIASLILLIYTLEKNKKVENRKAQIYGIPIILLSSTYFIYNNSFFRAINGIIIILLFVIMSISLNKDKIKLPQFLYKIIAVIFGTIESINDVIEYFKKFKISIKTEKHEKAFKIGKAILISIPIVIIVLALLMSADSIFAGIFDKIFETIGKIFTIKGGFSILLRIGLIFVTFCCFAGFLINLTADNTMFTQKDDKEEGKTGPNIENITINTILTILNIIYLIFSIIQFTSLFGKVGNSPDFNYAEYARQGFFQLMFVTFINFIVLWIANSNKAEEEKSSKKYKKTMSIAIILFTIIIIISAFYRMNLYEQEYGYTYLRLFVYFALATELILTIPILLYLFEKKINLIKTSIAIVTVMYVGLNFINIDNLIAKKNIDRYMGNPEKRNIDLSYLIQNTGTDAISQIIRLLDAKNEYIVQRVENYLYNERENLQSEEKNWQELNFSKLKAEKELSGLQLNRTTSQKYQRR